MRASIKPSSQSRHDVTTKPMVLGAFLPKPNLTFSSWPWFRTAVKYVPLFGPYGRVAMSSRRDHIELFKERCEAIVSRIQNNDASFTELKFHHNPTQGGKDVLDYSTAIDHMRLCPGVLVEALRQNTCITSIYMNIGPNGPLFETEAGASYDFWNNWAKPNEQLAQTMGAMQSLQSLTIDDTLTFHSVRERDTIIAFYLRSVRQIKTLYFKITQCGTDSVAVLDAALTDHPNLENLAHSIISSNERNVQQNFFPFPSSLFTIPNLQSLRLEPVDSDNKKVELFGL